MGQFLVQNTAIIADFMMGFSDMGTFKKYICSRGTRTSLGIHQLYNSCDLYWNWDNYFEVLLDSDIARWMGPRNH